MFHEPEKLCAAIVGLKFEFKIQITALHISERVTTNTIKNTEFILICPLLHSLTMLDNNLRLVSRSLSCPDELIILTMSHHP